MTHVTCRLTAKNRDQLRNPTLCNRVWATFTFYMYLSCVSADECSSLWWLCTSPLDLLLRQTGSIKRCSQHMNGTELDPNSEHVYCIGTVHVGGRSRTLRFSSVQFCSCTVNAPLLNWRLDWLQMTVDWQHRCKNVFNVFLFWSRFYVFNVFLIFQTFFI